MTLPDFIQGLPQRFAAGLNKIEWLKTIIIRYLNADVEIG